VSFPLPEKSSKTLNQKISDLHRRRKNKKQQLDIYNMVKDYNENTL